MHATLHDFATPIEIERVLLGQRRQFDRHFERRRSALFAREGGLVGRIAAVQRECGLERVAEAGGGFFLGVLLMNPRAVTAVDGAVPVKEEGGKGEIVIELKEREIER